jgi:eukaryotic-like serine/threonine-protein kinase
MQGRVIASRYRLAGPLGQGGMGVVWRARDELLVRDVAIKEVQFPPGLAEDERDVLRERTAREARSAARISHPNVVTVYDVVEEDARPWIVMEYVRARSLAQAVHDDGPLPARRVAEIGLAVLTALRVAHAKGVLHRDVKPSNVLLGDDGRVVLTDFGIATFEGDASLTRSGMLLGAPAYIAPERARGHRSGRESDLWSLGATLYTAVEGRPPYERGGALPTLTAVVTEDPDPPRLAGPLWPVISGLLRREPARRIGATQAEQMLREAAVAPGRLPAARIAGGVWQLPADAQVASDTRAMPALPDAPAAEPAAAPALEPPVRDSGPRPVGPATTDGPRSADRPPAERPGDAVPLPVGLANPDGPGLVARPPAEPRAPAAGGSRPTSRRALAAAAAVVLLAGSLLGWLALRSDGNRNAPDSAAPSSAAPSSPARESVSATAPAGQSEPGPGPGSGAEAGVPAGFRLHRDTTGFAIAVPAGWQASRRDGRVYFTGPDRRLLIIDQTDRPKGDPVADWTAQEAARRGGYQDYERIRIAEVDYYDAAADWEFRYTRDGTRLHVQNRGFVTAADKAYAIYWSTPDHRWAADRRYLDTFVRTFRPAS